MGAVFPPRTATRPLAIQKNGTWYTYGWDLTKNICETYRTDGRIDLAYTYTPYGEVSPAHAYDQPIQWSSEYHDVESPRRLGGGLDKHEVFAPKGRAPKGVGASQLGLVYYNYRHYNPQMGRWMRQDPVFDFAHIHAYKHNNNSPIIQFDSLGLFNIAEGHVNLIDENFIEEEIQLIKIIVKSTREYIKIQNSEVHTFSLNPEFLYQWRSITVITSSANDILSDSYTFDALLSIWQAKTTKKTVRESISAQIEVPIGFKNQRGLQATINPSLTAPKETEEVTYTNNHPWRESALIRFTKPCYSDYLQVIKISQDSISGTIFNGEVFFSSNAFHLKVKLRLL